MNISDVHCLAIGRITVAFSDLDSWLDSFIWPLIVPFEEQHVGQIVTAELSFSKKIDLLASLFKYRCKDPVKQSELKALLACISELEHKRNTIQHSLWIRQSENDEEATRLKFTAKRKYGLNHAKEVVTAESLNDLVEQLSKARSDLFSFQIKYFMELEKQFNQEK